MGWGGRPQGFRKLMSLRIQTCVIDNGHQGTETRDVLINLTPRKEGSTIRQKKGVGRLQTESREVSRALQGERAFGTWRALLSRTESLT